MSYDLVICIGNEARGDDAVAHRVAELLRGRLPESVRLEVAPQLDVAMADDAAEAEQVIIVDAMQRQEADVGIRHVEAAPHGEYGHALEPGHLLDIAFSLYAARPRMTLVTVAAPEMAHSGVLSPMAEEAAHEAAEVVLELLGL